MEIIADFLLISGALGASIYCFILGRKLNRFNSLEKGVGGAVAILSAQVDDLEKTLREAQNTASDTASSLVDMTSRAEETCRKLELQIASLHDVTKIDDPQPKNSELKSEPMFVRHSEKVLKN